MRDVLDEGIARFNARRWFEAHESFEDLWRGAAGDDRPIWQGIVQCCAGLVKHQRGQTGPALTLLDRGLATLSSAGEASRARCGLDVARLETGLRRVREALRRGLPFEPPAMERSADI